MASREGVDSCHRGLIRGGPLYLLNILHLSSIYPMFHETVVFAKGKIAQPNVSDTMIKNFTAVVWSSMLVITLISIA